MADEPLDNGDRKQVGGELILPFAAVLFSIYYFTTIREVPWTAQVSAVLVGSVLIVLCIAFAIRTLLGVYYGGQSLDLGTLIAPRAFLGKRLLLLALTIGYIAIIEWLGFTLTTFMFLALAMGVLGEWRRIGLILTISALLSITGYLLFIVAFEIRFPLGPFEAAMKAAF